MGLSRSECSPIVSMGIHTRSIVCDILFLDNIEWNEFFRNETVKEFSTIQDVVMTAGMIVVACTGVPAINGIFIVIESVQRDQFQLVRIDTPMHGDHFVVKYGKFINITYAFTVSNDVYIATDLFHLLKIDSPECTLRTDRETFILIETPVEEVILVLPVLHVTSAFIVTIINETVHVLRLRCGSSINKVHPGMNRFYIVKNQLHQI